jgi:hypothetical protein
MDMEIGEIDFLHLRDPSLFMAGGGGGGGGGGAKRKWVAKQNFMGGNGLGKLKNHYVRKY